MSDHDELTYFHTDQHSFDENQSPTKSSASSGKNEAHDVRKLLMLGLLHYFSSFSDTSIGADEDEFFDALESLGDDSDD
jgi:hypothetical protein